MGHEEIPFSYFISHREMLVVICLVGRLNKAASIEIQRCIEEIEKLEFKRVVLSLRDVTGVDKPSLPVLARLQLAVRNRGAELRLCHLAPALNRHLKEQGLLRPTEVVSDLRQAVQGYSFSSAAA